MESLYRGLEGLAFSDSVSKSSPTSLLTSFCDLATPGVLLFPAQGKPHDLCTWEYCCPQYSFLDLCLACFLLAFVLLFKY